MDSGKRDFPQAFQETVGKPLELSVPLSEHSHFRIGGNTDYFFCARSVQELRKALVMARNFSLYCYVMGGGFNLLFEDEGFRGLVVKNGVEGIEQKDKGLIQCASGSTLKDLLEYCTARELGGLEFLAGIPGTLGGAVCGNAGAFDEEIGERVVEAILFDEKDKEVRRDNEYFSFDYRYSVLKDSHEVVLAVVLQVEQRTKSLIEAKIEDILERRKKKHPPWDVACAGSFFQNPVSPEGIKVAAAHLLDRVGAKGLSKGDAAVYEGHANFIINRGNASAKDVVELASELKKRVKEEFGVQLKEEVIRVPATPPSH
jgi:UDP-N-acetylmuramate dehydrogenase